MKKTYFIICVVVIFIVLIPIVFHLWFAIGMIYNNRQKTIDTDWVKQYKTTIKTDSANISDIKVYYQHGRVHFDFSVNPKMSVDEYNSLVKKTKDLVIEETISKVYDDQTNLSIKFDSGNDTYVYESPYWIPTEDVTDNPNETIENNYKIWYLQINKNTEIKMQF
jgi:hypothetical protein